MMKKLIIVFSALAALLLAGCSLDETREINRGRAIEFRTSFDKTRAVETKIDNLNSIYVTAIRVQQKNETENYFDDAEFAKITNVSGTYHYDSEPKYYWPAAPADTLNFFAYSPNKDLATSPQDIKPSIKPKDDTKSNKTLDYKPAADIANQVDVVVAKAQGWSAKGYYGTELKFDHILSQIEIKAQCDTTSPDWGSWYVEVDSVKISEVKEGGTFDFKDITDVVSLDDWNSNSYSIATYIIGSKIDTLAPNIKNLMDTTATPAPGNAMLIPQQLTAWTSAASGTRIGIKIRAIMKNGHVSVPQDGSTGYQWVYVPIDTQWDPGYHYTYILNFTKGLGTDDGGTPIVTNHINFTVDVTPWSNYTGPDTNIDMPNTNS